MHLRQSTIPIFEECLPTAQNSRVTLYSVYHTWHCAAEKFDWFLHNQWMHRWQYHGRIVESLSLFVQHSLVVRDVLVECAPWWVRSSALLAPHDVRRCCFLDMRFCCRLRLPIYLAIFSLVWIQWRHKRRRDLWSAWDIPTGSYWLFSSCTPIFRSGKTIYW